MKPLTDWKAGCGKSARPVWEGERSNQRSYLILTIGAT